MIEALLSFPTTLGSLLFMGLASAIGLTIYYVTFRLYSKGQTDESKKVVGEAIGNLFRVVGWLYTLLLSLTFTDVIGELAVTETTLQAEATAISDTHHNLLRFGTDEARAVQALLVDYTQAIVDDDWPALAHDRLSERAEELLRQLEDAVLDLQPANTVQETLLSRVIADMDMISNHRLTRLQQAREQPSVVLAVVFFGYLVTMVFFGIYPPRRILVGFLSLYTVIVGVVIYLILVLSDPFQGSMAIDPSPLEYMIETMKADRAAS